MSASPLRVLHIISPVRQGGGESLLASLTIGKGADEFVALFYRSTQFEATLTRGGVAWQRLTSISLGDGKGRFGSALGALYGLPGLVRLLRLIRRRRPAIVHVHSFPASVWVAALKALGLIDTPTLLTRHSLYAQHGAATRYVLRWMFSQYDRISTVSEASRQMMLAQFPGLTIDVVHNCVAEAFFAVAEPPPHQRIVFLQLGRFTPAKNHALVLDALASLLPSERARMSVWFAGAGETELQVRAQAARLGLTSDEVRFLGFVPHVDLPDVVAQAHFGLFPSLSEGFGIGAAECLAAGRPVLALNSDVMVEVVGPGGICVAADQLAAGFREMLECGSALGAMAREWAQRYRVEQTRAGYQRLYRELAGIRS
jgi:glycosyltransferase involved in cell wall biosynthesis